VPIEFFAHSAPRHPDGTKPPPPHGWQLLKEHLAGVAKGARTRAEAARLPGLPELADVAGWLHDLGKYRDEFQQYLEGKLAEGNPLTYHKQAGAAKAAGLKLNPVAFVVYGHHGGLPDKTDLETGIKAPAGTATAATVWERAKENCRGLGMLAVRPPQLRDPFHADLLTRVLFSCLVDADWADTGEHERKVNHHPEEPEPPKLDGGERLKRVVEYIAARAARPLEPHVKKARADVLAACLAKAECEPGLFSLTVPTGGGKTLAGLAFALKHAAFHKRPDGTSLFRRVIYVAPYMTILEQNADAIRAALNLSDTDPAVFEHYSLAEPPGDEDPHETRSGAAARRADNWDAPVIVTTNVQFFESLFSNKPGRCRKLHNIAGSVIVLDECQTLPPGLAAPTCGMLKQLTTDLGCTVVMCTATQPAFDHDKLRPDERLTATEIIPESMRQRDERDLFTRLKRVHVTWPKPADPPLGWPAVANEMRAQKKPRAALCVVNTKKAARDVFAELVKEDSAGAFHLSTGMCPQHRRERLASIRLLLDVGAPCYVVSTQLIEAGVDVDFPFVMRELAPLESVIQAAGRCNREGRIPHAGGKVRVFRSEEAKMPPDEWYNKGRSVLETDFLNDGYEPQIDRPDDIRSYFSGLYRTGELDKHSIQAKRLEEKYATIADDYKLIKDDTVPVVVEKWPSHHEEIASLLAQIEKEKRPRKALFRRLALFQVNIWRDDRDRLQPHLRLGPKDLLIWTSRYDDTVGIVEEIGWDAIV
jgi:CRISPR-associated endonuclease/helicase Cas3